MFKTSRAIAAGGILALLAACSNGGASPSAAISDTPPSVAPASVAPASEAASAEPSAAAGPIEVGYLPKDVVNKYFDAAKTGVDKAVTELGGAPVTKVGPQAADAAAQTLAQLADANRRYEAKHGFIFIVCATGRSADAMLHDLTVRLRCSTAEELRTAAEEQIKITRLRLAKLIGELG